MSGIHVLILRKVQTELEHALMDVISPDDPSRVGKVSINSLGETDPDEARVSVVVMENDPDQAIGGIPTALDRRNWTDEIVEVECGFAVTWRRTFTIKARCMLERTAENEEEAQEVASTVRERIETALLHISWADVRTETEYIARGCIAQDVHGEQRQGGGPPDSFDYQIKVQFAVLTTAVG